MNNPASGLNLDLAQLSDEQLQEAIRNLRYARLNDTERTKKSFAKKAVAKIAGPDPLAAKEKQFMSVLALAKTQGKTLTREQANEIRAKLGLQPL